MKVEFLTGLAGGRDRAAARSYAVRGETDRLTDVLLCRPTHLAPVPCCSATRESLRQGFEVLPPLALAQHRALEATLVRHDVRTHMLPPRPDMPDLCFTRDGVVMTPWGLLGLAPATAHRRAEAAYVADFARMIGVELAGTIDAGTAEGGDICIARDGLVIIGCSGARTDEAGAAQVAALFRRQGWRALICRFDDHFLHLDTQFCMVDANTALACVDVLDDEFLDAVAAEGIELVPVSYKDSRRLGCNILALGDRRILASSGSPAVTIALERHGFAVDMLDIDQFAHCGGGLHCLTMPLARTPSRACG